MTLSRAVRPALRVENPRDGFGAGHLHGVVIGGAIESVAGGQRGVEQVRLGIIGAPERSPLAQ